MRSVVLGGVSTILLVGCTLLVSTGDLGGAPGDAGAPGGDAGPTVLDAGAVGSIARDAEPDGTGAPFCQALRPAPTFCEDFDHGFLDLSRWDAVVAEGGGVVTLEGGRSASPPGALRSSVRRSGGTLYPPAFTVKRLGRPATTLRLEADVFVERWEAKPNDTRILGLQLGSGASFAASTVVAVDLLPEGAILCAEEWKDGSGSQWANHGQKPVAFNRWMHVTLSIGLSTRAVTIVVDNDTITDGTAVEGTMKDGDMSAYVGLYYAGVGSTGWDVLFDNVVIDAE